MRSTLKQPRMVDIRVTGNVVTLNKMLVRSLDLKAGDVIDFGISMMGDLYIYKLFDLPIGRYENKLIKVRDNCNQLRIYSKRSAQSVRNALGTELQNFGLYVGEAMEVDGIERCLPVIRRILMV